MNRESVSIQKTKRHDVLSFFVLLPFCLVLTVSIESLILFLFIRGVSQNVMLPAIGVISAEQLSSFLDSRLSLAAGGSLPLIPTLAIVLINWHKGSMSVLAVGCSAVASAMLSVVIAIYRIQILHLLYWDWQDTLVEVISLFRDYCIVLSLVQLTVGVSMLSLYRCIRIAKRKVVTHEESA